MNAIVKAKVNLPAVFSQFKHDVFSEFTDGVTSGFSVISYRGKVWRIRKGGKEESYLDANGDAVQSIEVVLVKSNPHPSKTYYETKYEEGSAETPRCWSPDGIKPDVGVQNPISAACANCPKNAWGSKISETGSKTKACADVRRMAVVFRSDLEEKGAAATPFLMRVPPASLNPLKDYVENMLAPRGIPPFAVVTRVGFDNQVAYAKMTFKPASILADEEAAAVVAIRSSSAVKNILSESTEFAGDGAKTDGDSQVAERTAPLPAEAVVTAAPSPAAKPKRRPVEEEEVEVEDEPPTPAPKKAAKPAPKPVVEEEEAEEAFFEEPVKVAVKAPVVAELVEEDEAPAPKAKAKKATTPPAAAKPDDFDSMLDSILNG